MNQRILNTSIKAISFIALVLSIANCKKEDSDTDSVSYTITVGVFSVDGSGEYVATGNELIFDSKEECQTWKRNANGDSHSIYTHFHHNAAASVSYDAIDTILAIPSLVQSLIKKL